MEIKEHIRDSYHFYKIKLGIDQKSYKILMMKKNQAKF